MNNTSGVTKKSIMDALKDYPADRVEVFALYCLDLIKEVDKKTKQRKNWWIQNMTTEELAEKFRKVAIDEMYIDGEHITLSQRGVSYDYQAYKNRMLLVYPESLVDVSLVYEGDVFSSKKDSGKVAYSHDIVDPFNRSDDKIKGGYCVIKNKRGHFLTLLSQADFQKHREVAKTDAIWKKWYPEMCMKTVVKKACSKHFNDIYQNMEEVDNDNYDLDLAGQPVSRKQELEAIDNLDDLKEYWEENQGLGKDFMKMMKSRKQEIIDEQKAREMSAPKEEAPKQPAEEPKTKSVTPPKNENS